MGLLCCFMKTQKMCFHVVQCLIVLLNVLSCGPSTKLREETLDTRYVLADFWGKPHFLDFGQTISWKMEREWMGAKYVQIYHYYYKL